MGILISIAMTLSIFLTFYTLSFAVVKRSWRAMSISFIASLPISLYFAALKPPFSILSLTPILLLTLTIIFRRHIQKEIA